MAVPANTFKTYEAKGIREQLSNVIYNIAPEDVPFMSNAGRGPKAENTLFEWQTDDLAAADTANAQLEGDDANVLAATPTVRLSNSQQISTKAISISGTEEEVNKAGRKSELAYQITKRAAELKRDQESILLANQGANAGAAGTARKTGALLAFVKTNVDKHATGVNPVYTNYPSDVRTDGTLRSVTEAMLKNVIQLSWAQGGKPDTIMVGGTIKQAMSAFAGIATKTYQMTQAKTAAIIGAADVYVSDFGTFVIVPNRFQRTRDVHVLDFDLVSLRHLRPYRVFPLAKTGDSEKREMLVEYGLQVNQEKGIGLIADVQP
jgi:hypothetical protein